jgi:hypothetical protein
VQNTQDQFYEDQHYCIDNSPAGACGTVYTYRMVSQADPNTVGGEVSMFQDTANRLIVTFKLYCPYILRLGDINNYRDQGDETDALGVFVWNSTRVGRSYQYGDGIGQFSGVFTCLAAVIDLNNVCNPGCSQFSNDPYALLSHMCTPTGYFVTPCPPANLTAHRTVVVQPYFNAFTVVGQQCRLSNTSTTFVLQSGPGVDFGNFLRWDPQACGPVGTPMRPSMMPPPPVPDIRNGALEPIGELAPPPSTPPPDPSSPSSQPPSPVKSPSPPPPRKPSPPRPRPPSPTPPQSPARKPPSPLPPSPRPPSPRPPVPPPPSPGPIPPPPPPSSPLPPSPLPPSPRPPGPLPPNPPVPRPSPRPPQFRSPPPARRPSSPSPSPPPREVVDPEGTDPVMPPIANPAPPLNPNASQPSIVWLHHEPPPSGVNGHDGEGGLGEVPASSPPSPPEYPPPAPPMTSHTSAKSFFNSAGVGLLVGCGAVAIALVCCCSITFYVFCRRNRETPSVGGSVNGDTGPPLACPSTGSSGIGGDGDAHSNFSFAMLPHTYDKERRESSCGAASFSAGMTFGDMERGSGGRICGSSFMGDGATTSASGDSYLSLRPPSFQSDLHASPPPSQVRRHGCRRPRHRHPGTAPVLGRVR